MGGDSGEFDVSIASAAKVQQNLDAEKYKVYPVLIKAGKWIYKTDEGESINFDRNSHGILLKGELITFDCAFIAIHGTPGEDGKLQGYLELAGIPYTTCDVTTSAITFNKYFCNDLAIQYGANVVKTILIRRGEHWKPADLVKTLDLPCFVKPNKSGSSVGVSKVIKIEDIDEAVKKAFLEDDEVLVQQCMKGREMACGAFEMDGSVKVLPVTEIISKNEFFDYKAKYTKGLASEITPAQIPDDSKEDCHRLTAALYRRFNCRGVVRFDYFLDGNTWWFLEVNTVPGFSAESIIPKQVKAAGYSLKTFYGTLVEEAIRRKSL